MFHSLLGVSVRAITLYAVIVNVCVLAAIANFLFTLSGDVALQRYFGLVSLGMPDFMRYPQHFEVETGSGRLHAGALLERGTWSAALIFWNLTWLVPFSVLYAFNLIVGGIRPDLASQGVVKLGVGTEAAGDDSISYFGVTTGAMIGVGILGALGVVFSYYLGDADFLRSIERQGIQGANVSTVSNGIEGYKDRVRAFLGTAPKPAQASSAPAFNGPRAPWDLPSK